MTLVTRKHFSLRVTDRLQTKKKKGFSDIVNSGKGDYNGPVTAARLFVTSVFVQTSKTPSLVRRVLALGTANKFESIGVENVK